MSGEISSHIGFPIGSMYGMFTYIYCTHQPNVGKEYHTWILWICLIGDFVRIRSHGMKITMEFHHHLGEGSFLVHFFHPH